MLRALRRRLTVRFAALTALVLAGALAVTWQLASRQYQTSANALFDSTLAALCDRLGDADTVADSWLAEQEQAARAVILLVDNGTPLHFAGRLTPATDRNTLLPLAAAQATAAGLDADARQNGAAVRQTVSFALTGTAGEPYQCAAALLPRGSRGQSLTLYLLQDTRFLARHRRLLAAQYAGLWALGAALLAGISWVLAGKALVPTKQALQRQNEFIAAASHELRSPLAVIKASLAALQDGDLPPAQAAALRQSAGAEADRMTRLVEDLLLLAGGDAGALQVRLQPTAADTVCIEVYDQFALLARQSRHPLTLTLPEGAVPAVNADPERLKQLLAILLHNAFDHTPPGTPVELVLALHPARRPTVTLAVVDHGPGIPDAEKARVFDRFYRADQSRTAKENFGLGLSVARALAALHGAPLRLTDTPGGGATFALELPAPHEAPGRGC